jgi:hypothetical protein
VKGRDDWCSDLQARGCACQSVVSVSEVEPAVAQNSAQFAGRGEVSALSRSSVEGNDRRVDAQPAKVLDLILDEAATVRLGRARIHVGQDQHTQVLTCAPSEAVAWTFRPAARRRLSREQVAHLS